MEPMWGIVIGAAVGGLVYQLIALYKERSKNRETKGYAIASILLGLCIVIPFISLIGLLLGISSYRRTPWKKLSLLGIVICSLASVLWALIFIGK